MAALNVEGIPEEKKGRRATLLDRPTEQAKKKGRHEDEEEGEAAGPTAAGRPSQGSSSGGKPTEKDTDEKTKEKDKKLKEAVAKKKRDADFRSGQRKFLTVMVKQLLQTTQISRELQGIITEVFILDAEEEICKSMRAQTVAYSRDQPKGPPHIYAAAGLINTICLMTKEQLGEISLNKLTELKKDYDQATITERSEMVRHCQLHTLFRQDRRKVTIVLRHQFAEEITKAMVLRGAEQKFGKAPAGYMERELQEWLLALE